MTRTRNIFKQNWLKYVGIINVKKKTKTIKILWIHAWIYLTVIFITYIEFFFLQFFTFLTLQNNIIFKHNLRLEIHTTYKPPPPQITFSSILLNSLKKTLYKIKTLLMSSFKIKGVLDFFLFFFKYFWTIKTWKNLSKKNF